MDEIMLEKCTACSACKNICPTNAIQMKMNNKGFFYPDVKQETCVKCGQCDKVCPVLNCNKIKQVEKEAVIYAMQSNDEELRLKSTSGGAFSELANIVLQKNGCIVGAAYTEKFFVKHQIIGRAEDLEKLRRSKYQQSEIGLVFRKIKELLTGGRWVLFCGTPCQAAGLKAFLGEKYERLYVIDFICRGVPSPKLFQKYMQYLEKQYESKVQSVWMKNKRNGWHSLTTVITFENGQEYVKDGVSDPYVQLYLKYNLGTRESCFSCQFKDCAGAADITLGDFWGLNSNMDDNYGTSVLICRTQKGKELAERIAKSCKIVASDIEAVTKGNPCLIKSVEKLGYDEKVFYKILEQDGFNAAYQWVIKQSDVKGSR